MDLKDGMSNPASQMKSALKGVESQMRSTEAELRKLAATQLQYKQAGFGQGAKEVGNDMAKLRLQLGEARAQHGELATAAKSGAAAEAEAAQAATMAAGAFAAVAAVAGVAAFKLGELAVEGAKTALEMNELREHTTRMFEGLSGSQAGGEEMYKQLQQLRKILPESEKDLSGWAAKLMGAGMTDPTAIKESIKSLASASALMGGGEQGAAAAEKISGLIAKSLESGKFKGMTKMLVGTGVTENELAQQLGMTPANFQAAFKKGTIEAQKGIDALNAVLQTKGRGAIEGTMGELPVMIAKAKEAFAHLFDGVDVKPFTEAMRQLVGIIDTAQPSGRAMNLTLVDAFNGIMKAGAFMVRSLTFGFLYVELGALKMMHWGAPFILLLMRVHKSGLDLLVLKAVFAGIAGAIALMVAPLIQIADAMMSTLGAAQKLAGLLPGMKSPTGPEAGGGGSDWGSPTIAPAHSAGGIVMAPPPGEAFTSVAPGEAIVPRGGLNVGGGRSEPSATGSRSTSVDVGGIHIDGAGKSAHEIVALLESSLADLFDRAALEVGG